MKFKALEWEKRGNGCFVANVAFGIQLIVAEVLELDKWVWEIGNLSFVFKSGKSNSEFKAKAKAERLFQEYVTTNLQKCTE
jgi:hypothetical protein